MYHHARETCGVKFVAVAAVPVGEDDGAVEVVGHLDGVDGLAVGDQYLLHVAIADLVPFVAPAVDVPARSDLDQDVLVEHRTLSIL
ncbi:hypothetical protein Taro_007068 [Colocasia esculenta]|uniref:Uncharacterized protein n=1 Tax=Colocasia esculenta TaxID=4460 RepID=A0A843TZH5_COLES|nr:hypothetical protein [Colocasia esculenta]